MDKDNDNDNDLNQDNTHDAASQFVTRAHFRFRTLTEGQIIAEFIASVCPNPHLAVIGITEIFINAIEHGNLAITYEEKTSIQKGEDWAEEIERRLNLPENKDKMVEVEMTRSESEITLVVTDQGSGFRWRQYEDLDEHRVFDTHGRGITLARGLVFSRIEFSKKGNEVTCVVPLK